MAASVSVSFSMDVLLALSPFLTLYVQMATAEILCFGRWQWQRGVQTRSIVLLTNIQTFHLLPALQMLPLCTFQWAEWDFPVFPTPKAVADLWLKFRWWSRTTNSVVMLIKDTFENMQLLSNVSDAQFREISCCGWTSFIDFGCTIWNTSASASCPSSGSCWLTIPTMLPVEGAGQSAPCPTSGGSSKLAQALGSSRNSAECVWRECRDSHVGPLGWQSCGDAAPGRKHYQTAGKDLSPKSSATLIKANDHRLPQDSSFLDCIAHPKWVFTP